MNLLEEEHEPVDLLGVVRTDIPGLKVQPADGASNLSLS